MGRIIGFPAQFWTKTQVTTFTDCKLVRSEGYCWNRNKRRYSLSSDC